MYLIVRSLESGEIDLPSNRRTLKTCIICGGYFLGSHNAKYCEYCKENPSVTDKPKKRNGRPCSKKVKKPQNSGKSIKEILAELEAYNREHGTRYTYGQYIELIEGR